MRKRFQSDRAKKTIAVCKKWLQFCLNPRLLLCFGLAWFITNGWCYVFATVGAFFGITWMVVAGSAWAAFLWFPFTPEKIVTVIIAIFLLRVLFPKDQKTLLVLHAQQEKVRKKMHAAKEKRRAKRRVKWLKKELSVRRRTREK